MAKKILWIDDDINRDSLRAYVDELDDNGFSIIRAANPDVAEKILKNEKDFGCIIIDISIPTGANIGFEEAKAGTQTGLVFLKKLIDNNELNHSKKVVFTIVDVIDVTLFCKEKNVTYIPKQKELPDTFCEKIKGLI